jgi:hypothetical protein
LCDSFSVGSSFTLSALDHPVEECSAAARPGRLGHFHRPPPQFEAISLANKFDVRPNRSLPLSFLVCPNRRRESHPLSVEGASTVAVCNERVRFGVVLGDFWWWVLDQRIFSQFCWGKVQC